MDLPFVVGRIVSPEEFVDREKEIRRCLSLIASGQSVGITGDPRIGKSSLLHYLQAPHVRESIAHNTGRRPVFVYMDSQTWPADFSQERFWERSLQPLVEALHQQGSHSPGLEAFEVSRAEGFSTFTLERLLARMQVGGWQLVLLLDEFDTVLGHPMLHKTEFYGGLRSLASRYGTAFTLVIASRQSLSVLNQRTQEYTRTGSPFFNFVREIPLKPFERKDALALLDRARDRFTPEEREWLLNLTGGFPYLLQIAGDALWHAYEDGQDAAERQKTTYQALLRAADDGMRDIWLHWTPDMRKAFAFVALDMLAGRLGRRAFDVKPLRDALQDLPRALRLLEERGYLRQAGTESGYTLTAWVMLGWVVEELLRAFAPEEDVAQALAREEWLGPLKRKERETLTGALRILWQGARDLILRLLRSR